MKNNRIEGSIPLFFSSFGNLQMLYLSLSQLPFTSLSLLILHRIPPMGFSFDRDLSVNQLIGTIPKAFASLGALTQLYSLLINFSSPSFHVFHSFASIHFSLVLISSSMLIGNCPFYVPVCWHRNVAENKLGGELPVLLSLASLGIWYEPIIHIFLLIWHQQVLWLSTSRSAFSPHFLKMSRISFTHLYYG